MTASYLFCEPTLEETALTHKSFGRPHNERLEWLGDAVLEFEVSRLLYERFDEVSEDGLTLLRLQLVRGESLAALARRLGLAERLRLGGAAARRERDNDNILAGVMEAYIAAVYLDGGDIGKFLADWLEEDIARLAAELRQHGVAALRDAKTRLQEHLQQRGLPPPSYVLLKAEGKAHRRVFFVECRAEVGVCARAAGASLAAAEQQTAAECLRVLFLQDGGDDESAAQYDD